MTPRLLMCRPTFFGVHYVINPWMEGQVGRATSAAALAQWQQLYDTLSARAEVQLVDPVEGLPDMPFVANAGLVLGRLAVPSVFRHVQRRGEQQHFIRCFESLGLQVCELDDDLSFEGEGDALFQPGHPLLWAGYGFRSSLESHRRISEMLDVEVVSLRLVDPRFYHLDTCFAPLSDGRLLYYPRAFDEPSLDEIERRLPAQRRLAVGDDDAASFVCNLVQVGSELVANHASESLVRELEAWGLTFVPVALGEFLLAGGAAKCLTLRLEQDVPAPVTPTSARRFVSPISDRHIELRGHLLDSGLMNRVFDTTTERGGSFRVEEFSAGVSHQDESLAVVKICAPTAGRLEELLADLIGLGATVVSAERDARLTAVTQAGVAPLDFYSTTIYPTHVRLAGQWHLATEQRMDAVLVVRDASASAAPDSKDANMARASSASSRVTCRLIRDLQVGDAVVCGVDGIRVQTPRSRESDEAFSFMSAGVSSERRVELVVDQLAWEMQQIRARQGRIVVVGGPVVIHTGGGPYLSRLIRAGYVQALLGGNAIAVHDLELQVYGTSLGVDLARGRSMPGGHQHHIKTINLIRSHGGIREAVQAGLIRDGVMHACVTCGVPFVLAGSIRDDGPLPETLMDLVEAQRQYAAAIRGADMILMLSSMLHAIGTGNMTPAGVKLVCVDISPAVVTKLADRGSIESVGVVTDVGLFLNLLARRLLSSDR